MRKADERKLMGNEVGLKLGMHLILILPAGYPANLKTGYRISSAGRISGRIFNSTFKYLVKY
jgi:hypothetical protein